MRSDAKRCEAKRSKAKQSKAKQTRPISHASIHPSACLSLLFFLSSGEPLFVPRPGSTAEDDGWVLGILLDAASNSSLLVILDASSMAQVAVIDLGITLPYALHSSFTSFLPQDMMAAAAKVD